MAARFKKGHGICKLAVQEELNASVDTFCKEFPKCTEEQNLQPDQIYNADITGVYGKGLPTKTFPLVYEKSALGHNSSQEHSTLLWDVSGNNKNKLLVTGKTSLDHLRAPMATISLCIIITKLDRDIFDNWFNNKWCPEAWPFLKKQRIVSKSNTAYR